VWLYLGACSLPGGWVGGLDTSGEREREREKGAVWGEGEGGVAATLHPTEVRNQNALCSVWEPTTGRKQLPTFVTVGAYPRLLLSLSARSARNQLQRILNNECRHVWDASPRSPYANQLFGGMYSLHLQSSAETSVHIRTVRRYIPEDADIHKYRCDNLKSYTAESRLIII
jgi:hypothetical protein